MAGQRSGIGRLCILRMAVLWLLTASHVSCFAQPVSADALPQPEATRSAIAPGLIRLQLSRHVEIDVPRDWTFRDATIHDWVHKAASAAIDVSGNPTQHKAGTELLLLALSGPGETAATLGLAFTPHENASGGDASDPARLSDPDLQSRLTAIDALMRADPAAEITPMPLTRFSFPGKAAYPAVSFTYIRMGDMGTALTQIWSIWRPDGIVTLALSYQMTEADKWSPIMHQIGDSLFVE